MADLHSKLLAAMLTSDGEIRPLLEKVEGIVKAELDQRDAEIGRLTAQLAAQAEAMRELDDKATEAYEARDAALHDCDEEARTAVSLRKELHTRTDDHALVEAFVAEQFAGLGKRVLPTTTAIGCVRQLAEVLTERAEEAEIQWCRLRDRMHGLAQQWRGGRAPGPEFGHALEAAVIQLDDETKES